MESNKALNPVDVAFLGFIGVMPDPKHLTDLIKQLRRGNHTRTDVLRSVMLFIVRPYAVRFSIFSEDFRIIAQLRRTMRKLSV